MTLVEAIPPAGRRKRMPQMPCLTLKIQACSAVGFTRIDQALACMASQAAHLMLQWPFDHALNVAVVTGNGAIS
ncbi:MULTISPECIES: hypothetical protein [unclassified Alcanivorax]|uniref:hypothetical protein n=1 Tax=unclassified Alcanivorax TaxID=2638842 RepID=UPI0012DF678D|nr:MULTISPECIES: hypothetical protein [unclassified Alcanivorax]